MTALAINFNLTADESATLVEAESAIQAGIKSFWEVGNALAKIRDAKLYRDTHGTFEDYCQARWDITRQYANRLIGAFEVVENLETIVSKPESEAVARPLAPLPPNQQREAWTDALERTGGTPTGRDVAVREVPEAPSRPRS